MASGVSELTLLHRDLNRLRDTFDWQGGQFVREDKTLAKTAQIFAQSLDLIQRVQHRMGGVLGRESRERHLEHTRLAIITSFSDFASRVRHLHHELQTARQKDLTPYEKPILELGDSIRVITLLTHAHFVQNYPDNAAEAIWNDAELPYFPQEEEEVVEEKPDEHEPKRKAGPKEVERPVFEGFPFAPGVSVDWLSATRRGAGAGAASGEQPPAIPWTFNFDQPAAAAAASGQVHQKPEQLVYAGFPFAPPIGPDWAEAVSGRGAAAAASGEPPTVPWTFNFDEPAAAAAAAPIQEPPADDGEL